MRSARSGAGLLGDGRGAANRPSSGGEPRAAVAPVSCSGGSSELQRRPASRGLGVGRAAPRTDQGVAAGREATPRRRRDGEQDLQRRRPDARVSSVKPKNRAEQTETECVGFQFSHKPIGCHSLETKIF